MASDGKRRLYLACVYLGALLLVAGGVLHYLLRFSGTVFLLPDSAERLAFCLSDGQFRLAASQREVAPDLLLFDNPRSLEALRADQHYDSVVLPFSLRLDKVEIVKEHAPRDVLYLEGPDLQRREEARPGTQISLGSELLSIESTGPWEGLVRVPGGQPMVAVEVPGATRSLAFLESGRVYTLQPDLAACFIWNGSEAEARQAFVPALSAVPGARWGVRDGKAIQWFENFIPGTGAILLDGTRVTLAKASRESGEITLSVERSAGKEVRVVKANEQGGDAPFVYEDPAATGRVLYLHGWREDRVIARLLSRDRDVQEFELGTGKAGAPVILRQIMSQAVAVPAGTVRAAEVRVGETSLVLREGSAETVGNYRLRYQTESVPPDARYHIAVLNADGTVRAEHDLEVGDTIREGAWGMRLSEENPFAPRGVALTLERQAGRWGQGIGLVLFALGSVGWVTARFLLRS